MLIHGKAPKVHRSILTVWKPTICRIPVKNYFYIPEYKPGIKNFYYLLIIYDAFYGYFGPRAEKFIKFCIP